MRFSASYMMQKTVLSAGAWNGVFFRKTLIYILFIASIPGLLLGGGMYVAVTGQIERELLRQHEKQIGQLANTMDEQLSYLEISLSHWAFEAGFNETMKKTDYYYNFQATREVNQNLLIKQGSHPLLYSMELYINGQKPLLFNPSQTLVQVEKREQIEYYYTLMHKRGVLFWERQDSDSYNSLKLIHTIPGDSSTPFGILIATLDDKKLKGFLKTLTFEEGGTSFLLDRDKGIMASTSEAEDMKRLDSLLWKTVTDRADSSGSFIYQKEGQSYSVSYGKFGRINSEWMYISAAPMTSITSPVVFISKTILYVSLAVLLLATALSVLVSRKLYSPIGRLMGILRGEGGSRTRDRQDEFQFLEEQWRSLTAESLTLRTRMKAQRPIIREGFLLQLVQGYLSAFSERELVERMSLLGWNLDQQSYLMIHIQLTGFAEFSGHYTSRDEELFTFAAGNIIEELARSSFEQADVLNFHDLSIGLLLFLPDGMEYRSRVEQLCGEAAEAVNRLVRVRLSMTIGRPAASLRSIPHLFQEVKEASIYRDFSDRNQIIHLDQLDRSVQDNGMNYSFVHERELLQHLRLARQEEAEGALKAFLMELSAGGQKETLVQQGLLQLLGRMLNTMLQCGVNPHSLFKGVNMFDRLSQIREPDEMLQWMTTQVMAPFTRELSEQMNDHLREAVDKAVQFMREHYTSADMSLDMCAEYAGTSHYALSKAFKQYAGKNFIDYLTELRMEKAKDLIAGTALKMCDIAEMVGYQNGYFNRIFKKMEGITPKQYRDISRK